MPNIGPNASGPGLSPETAAWLPNPAQDYATDHVSLDRQLVRRPASRFVLRVAGDALASMNIPAGAELLVDRTDALELKVGDLKVSYGHAAFYVALPTSRTWTSSG